MTERAASRSVLDSGLLPEGALAAGLRRSTGDLLDHLGPYDVLAFTGSAATARRHAEGRSRACRRACPRLNVEADSLNAAVAGVGGGGSKEGGETFDLFLRDVVKREMTQKAGQKCTAVRRVLVPADRLGAVEEALAARLRGVVTGTRRDPEVTMGPVATASQLAGRRGGGRGLSRPRPGR